MKAILFLPPSCFCPPSSFLNFVCFFSKVNSTGDTAAVKLFVEKANSNFIFDRLLVFCSPFCFCAPSCSFFPEVNSARVYEGNYLSSMRITNFGFDKICVGSFAKSSKFTADSMKCSETKRTNLFA